MSRKTTWECDVCAGHGLVDVPAGEGVWTGVVGVIDDHRRVSPQCNGDRWSIRVRVDAVAERSEAPK